MTRKKFVKQLMARGVQRNDAEGAAMDARRRGWTYEEYLQTTYRAVETIKIILLASVNPVAEAAAKIIEQLRDAFARASQSMTDMQDALAHIAQGGGGHD